MPRDIQRVQHGSPVRPPTSARAGLACSFQLTESSRHHLTFCPGSQLMASLSFFIARTFTVFEAGFALKTQGSLVNGFTPLRAGVAGFFFNFMLSIPASLKEPVFFNSSEATPMIASTVPFTSFVFNPVVSATD